MSEKPNRCPLCKSTDRSVRWPVMYRKPVQDMRPDGPPTITIRYKNVSLPCADKFHNAPTPAPQDEAAESGDWIMAVDQAHGTCLTARIAALDCPPRGPQCGDASIGGGNCEAHAAAYKEWDAVRRRMSHG